MDIQTDATPSLPKATNWWKIGFFILLILLELAREIIVLNSSEEPKLNGSSSVLNFDGYTTATGRWTRIDGGDRLIPSVTSIQCRKDDGWCVEATTDVLGDSIFPPNIDFFDADFSADTITYENDRPDCARYSVRIDLKLKKTLAVRERIKNPNNANCNKLENRIEMQLQDAFQPEDDPLEGHFVPLVKIIGALF